MPCHVDDVIDDGIDCVADECTGRQMGKSSSCESDQQLLTQPHNSIHTPVSHGASETLAFYSPHPTVNMACLFFVPIFCNRRSLLGHVE